MIKKVTTIGIVAALILVGFLQKDQFLEIVEQGGTLSVFVSMLLVGICVFFPIVPFPVLAGLIGAVFGLVQGALISLTGAMIGTLFMFLLSRYGFRDYAQTKLQQYPKTKEYETLFEQNSFLSILLVRVIPLIPSPVVNIVCGLSQVHLLTFLAASTIGKLPNILVLSYAGSNVGESKWMSFGIYGIYVFIVTVIAAVIMYRRMAKEQPQ